MINNDHHLNNKSGKIIMWLHAWTYEIRDAWVKTFFFHELTFPLVLLSPSSRSLFLLELLLKEIEKKLGLHGAQQSHLCRAPRELKWAGMNAGGHVSTQVGVGPTPEDPRYHQQAEVVLVTGDEAKPHLKLVGKPPASHTMPVAVYGHPVRDA